MPYADYNLEAAEARLGILTELGDLFPNLVPVLPPAWLDDLLMRGRAVAALVSEKARSEFIVAPILLACRDLIPGHLAIFSGQRLDVDPDLGLSGECDHILALTEPVPRLRAPLVTILEAKRGDIELGLGQCAAQMTAARIFNERAGMSGPVYGVVTTGEAWQFLRLDGPNLTLNRTRLFVDNLGAVLAALQAALRAATPRAWPRSDEISRPAIP